MKKIILMSLLLIGKISYSQDANNKSLLPEIIPPSPTVANLMKFEEVPVSNYTGIPEIYESIYSKRLSNNFDLNLGLSYHALNVKVEDIASEIGLGWNLTGLGVISRNISEYPDEYLTPEEKIGIYRNNPSSVMNFNYYMNISSSNANLPSSELEQEFLWDTFVKGLYDTKYDIWQFNFCGKTGRFIIKKESNELIVHFLDNNPHNLKIFNYYDNNYTPIGFKVIDESGFEYYFSEVEKTSVDTSNQATSYYKNETNQTLNSLYAFNSAFHLTQIKHEDNIILNVNYDIATPENIINSSTKTYYPVNGPISFGGYVDDFIDLFVNGLSKDYLKSLFFPQVSNSASTNSYLSKKINFIEMINVGKINFVYQNNRLDDAYGLNNTAKILKSIIISDINNVQIKQVNFQHLYFDTPKKKLFLSSINLVNGSESITSSKYEYYLPNTNLLFSDEWGFTTDKVNKVVNKDLVYSYTLKRIIRPTGGFTEFEYESNTYSHIKSTPILNFEDNENNWIENSSYTIVNNINTQVNAFTITNQNNKVEISNFSIPNLTDWSVIIHRNNESTPVYSFNSCVSGTCKNTLLDLPIGTYSVEITAFTVGNPIQNNNVIINHKILYLKDENIQEKYLYGAGFRIKSIKTFKDVNSISSYKGFRYNFFDQFNKSSGSLNNDEPIYEYLHEYNVPGFSISLQDSGLNVYNPLDLTYKVNTSKNALVSSAMDGEIGYKNVTVDIGEDNIMPVGNRDNIEFINFNNGRIQITYSNSIDYPDESISNNPMYYIQGFSNHFKRGLKLNESYFDYSNKKLKESIFNYQFDQNQINTGVTIHSSYDSGNNINPTCKLFQNFSDFKLARANLNCFNGGSIYIYCGVDNLFNLYQNIGLYRNFIGERIGWAKLISQTNKEYFYSNSNLTGTVLTNHNFAYSSLNKKIAEQISTNSHTNELLKTKYFYAHQMNNQAMIDKNMIGIPLKTETYRDNEKLSTEETIYEDWDTSSSVFLAPKIIKASKGNNPLENKIKYNKIDLTNGNPLEVQQEDGIKISYIWGYNNTQPVAKLENIAYDAIPSSLITAIQSATDSPTPNETTILNALNALRTSTDVNLQKAMITTYTYKPLVGITSVTDPKGDKQTYHYDSFNRLEFVKDKNGNILSENKYHYRTQN